MNIQWGEKRRKETVSSAVRATLAVDKAIPRLVFHLSYPSHKTLQRCFTALLSVCTHVQAGWENRRPPNASAAPPGQWGRKGQDLTFPG